MDCSPPGSSVHGISQAITLELVAISFFRWSSWLRDWIHVYCIGRYIPYHWATREVQVYLCVYIHICICVYIYFSGNNTGVGCHFLLQVIFLPQGLNPCLPHWLVHSLPLSHQGSPSMCMCVDREKESSSEYLRFFAFT